MSAPSLLGTVFTRLGMGPVLVVVAAWLLFKNEGCAVREAEGIGEAAKVWVSVPADKVDPANEGKLVYTSAPVSMENSAVDEALGFAPEKSLKLARRVEIFQWEETKVVETRTKPGSKPDASGAEQTEEITKYSYATGWQPSPLDSTKFNQPKGHENPQEMPFKPETFAATGVKLGAFELSSAQADLLAFLNPYEVTAAASEAISQKLGRPCLLHEGKLLLPVESTAASQSSSSAERATQPQPGDIRIFYERATAETGAIMARQVGSGFAPYKPKTGSSLQTIRAKPFDPAQNLADKQKGSDQFTKFVRWLGCGLILVGTYFTMLPLQRWSQSIPWAGKLLGSGLHFVSVLVAGAISSSVIATAWIYFRPLYAYSLLGVGAGLLILALWFLFSRRRNSAENR